MSELDELISRHGVLMAGRFGPDWRVAETKSKGLFVELRRRLEVMGSFCEAIQSVLNALAVAMGGFSPSTWTPVHGWAASGGIYSIAVHGDRFVVVETDKVGASTTCARCCRPGSPEPGSTAVMQVIVSLAGGPGTVILGSRSVVDWPLPGFCSLPTVPDLGMFGVRSGRVRCGILVTGSGLDRPPRRMVGRGIQGLTLCSVAVEGGGPIMLMPEPAGAGGDMPSWGSSKCQVADRDGPVCCWRLWRGGSSAPVRYAW